MLNSDPKTDAPTFKGAGIRIPLRISIIFFITIALGSSLGVCSDRHRNTPGLRRSRERAFAYPVVSSNITFARGLHYCERGDNHVSHTLFCATPTSAASSL